MAKIHVHVTVARITDTGERIQELEASTYLKPILTVWAVLMLIRGALTSIEID